MVIHGSGVLLPCLVVLAALCVYLANEHFLESTDTVGNELLPLSVLEHGTLTFDQYYLPPDAQGVYATGAAALNPQSVAPTDAYRVAPELESKSIPWWFVRVGDHVVSLYPIAPGLLNTPTFAAARVLGVDLHANVVRLTHITTSVMAALSVLAMYLCLVQVCARRRTAVFFTLVFAFGTAVWSTNSRSLYQHGPATLFIAAGLACLLTGRRRAIALAGLALGVAVATRPINVVIAAAMAVYVCRHERVAFPGFVAFAAVPALLLTWYSWTYWDTPLALGQGQDLSRFATGEPAIAAAGLLVSPNRGLLVFSPVFVFSVVYAVYAVRRGGGPAVLPYLIWSGLALFGLYALWQDWHGGHTYGYRYLIELVPALTLLLAGCWMRFIEPRPYLRAVLLAAVLASVYVHGLGANVSPCGFDEQPNDIDAHHERLWDIADGEIVRCTLRQVQAVEAAIAARRSG